MRRGLARPGMRALDLATGTGYLARGLAQRGLDRHRSRHLAPTMMAAAQGAGCGAGPFASTTCVGKAEETGLPAAQLRPGHGRLLLALVRPAEGERGSAAAAEAGRLAGDLLAGLAAAAAATWSRAREAIVQRHNPKWPFGGLDGMKPGFVRDLRAAGFAVDRELLGRFRHPLQRTKAGAAACAPPPASPAACAPEQVKAFDAGTRRDAGRDFPQQPLQVAHCRRLAGGRSLCRSFGRTAPLGGRGL